MSNNGGFLMEVDNDKFSSTIIHHCSICFARSHSNWGYITTARLRESRARDADEPGTRRRCVRREGHGGSTEYAVPVVSVSIGAVIASFGAIAYIPTSQPFPPHRR